MTKAQLSLNEYPHHITEHVRFNDIDTMGHVNNARYLNYLEESRIAYFEEAAGFDRRTLAFDSVVARVDISYMQPIEYGDAVELYTRCLQIGTKSMLFETLILKHTPGYELQLAAKSVVTLVSFDKNTGRSKAVSPELIAKIEQYEGKNVRAQSPTT